MQRYRLRFQLQEVDLGPGETLLGRSSACHITIEDPLVSRRHTLIRVHADQPTVQDLGSRNGTAVNGIQIKGERLLEDGDRIRVGSVELVFCAVTEAGRDRAHKRRDTGAMFQCPACSNAYAEELDECPVCGAARDADEVTITGVVGGSEGWSMALVGAVLDKALSLQRWDDVDRVMRRARPTVERLVAGGGSIERAQLESVANAAAALAVHQVLPDWGVWLLTIYATLSLVPNAGAIEHLQELGRQLPGQLSEAARRLVTSVQAGGGPAPDEREAFERLKSLAR